MKLTSYAKLLTMTKDAIDKTLVPVRSRSQQLKAELEVSKLDEQIACLVKEITELYTMQDLNYNTIIDKLDELAIAERRQEQFRTIIIELFPKSTV